MEILQLIKESTAGNDQSQGELFHQVYDDLKRLAGQIRFDWRNEHTLNTTSLVHEAYLKVCNNSELTQLDKLHFYRICGQAMRFILNDYLKHKNAIKRGGNFHKIALDENIAPLLTDSSSEMVADLLEKIDRLRDHDPVICEVIDCRFFSDMSVAETSELLKISPATVKRKWAFARSYISSDLSQSA
ncbi:MAG: ECF-type sigma factor [Cyclobacteriaceae bacterium]